MTDSRVHLLGKGRRAGKMDLMNRLSIGLLEGAQSEDLLTD
jgi:hypothetical protein